MMNMDISNSEVAWKQESAGKVLNIHQNREIFKWFISQLWASLFDSQIHSLYLTDGMALHFSGFNVD